MEFDSPPDVQIVPESVEVADVQQRPRIGILLRKPIDEDSDPADSPVSDRPERPSWWREIAAINISDAELQPARWQVGFTCIGFSALGLGLFALYIQFIYPGLDLIEGIRDYWYAYIGLVSLGVTGLMMVGREALRVQLQPTQARSDPSRRGEKSSRNSDRSA